MKVRELITLLTRHEMDSEVGVIQGERFFPLRELKQGGGGSKLMLGIRNPPWFLGTLHTVSLEPKSRRKR
jgi:hypothetical protein